MRWPVSAALSRCSATTCAAAASSTRSLIVYEGARHELFNELNQEEVRADLIRWLDERFAVD